MSKPKKTTISHPIIESYIESFIFQNEIPPDKAIDQHAIFEQYINTLILNLYGNDPNASYEDMDTGTAFGLDGIAIFVADKMVTSISDVDLVIDELKKFEVSFYFIQSKTSDNFERTEISDFLTAVRRFCNFSKCEINELSEFWEIAKYLYSKSAKFKKSPSLHLTYACLSARPINLKDKHLASSIELGVNDLNDLNLFENVNAPDFLGIKEIMTLQSKATSELETSITMTKQPVPYPKAPDSKIKNGYYGLIKLEEFIKLLTDDINGKKVLRKGVFDDNIRYYLGSEEKVDVNNAMKKQLTSQNSYLFGLLNNGITVIGDKVELNSEELTLVNYQIVNGCQTSNVIFECLDNINMNNEIYLPIRLIATEDEDTKNAIIEATNSQTPLRSEQKAALLPVQKAIEQYYITKCKKNNSLLYYERRTEQYRDENIPRTKIITIPIQIKAASALLFDLPHEVSGQYGKVAKRTKGLLFNDTDIGFLNTYYVSGLAWYKVERFVQSHADGKKYRRARWHLIMLLKYLVFPIENRNENTGISKKTEKYSCLLEEILLDDIKSNKILEEALEIIKQSISKNTNLEDAIADRKIFERKETTKNLIDFATQYRKTKGI